MDLKENWSKKNIRNHASQKTQQYWDLFGQGKKNCFVRKTDEMILISITSKWIQCI